MLVSCIV